MAVNKNGIVVMGAVFVDIKGFPDDVYIPDGRNAGKVEYIHGGVSRNVVEDIANMELRPMAWEPGWQCLITTAIWRDQFPRDRI